MFKRSGIGFPVGHWGLDRLFIAVREKTQARCSTRRLKRECQSAVPLWKATHWCNLDTHRKGQGTRDSGRDTSCPFRLHPPATQKPGGANPHAETSASPDTLLGLNFLMVLWAKRASSNCLINCLYFVTLAHYSGLQLKWIFCNSSKYILYRGWCQDMQSLSFSLVHSELY